MKSSYWLMFVGFFLAVVRRLIVEDGLDATNSRLIAQQE